jgi:hypothetical protein
MANVSLHGGGPSRRSLRSEPEAFEEDRDKQAGAIDYSCISNGPGGKPIELALRGVTHTASMMRIGIAEQFQYILRDESMHLNFGVDVTNQVRSKTRTCGTPKWRKNS